MSSEGQAAVPWDWSPRLNMYIQRTCIGAMVMTDPDGRNPQRLLMASGRSGEFPEAVNELIEARNLLTVPPDNEWLDAEMRGIRYLKKLGKRLGAMGAGFDICYECDDAIRAEGIVPSTLTKRQRETNQLPTRKRQPPPPDLRPPYDPPPRPSGGPKHGR